MELNAQLVAEHAARVADAPVAVDRVADGDRVDQLLVGAALELAGLGQRPADIGVVDLVAADRHFHVGSLGRRLAAGDVDQHFADRLPRHLLGRVDGGADSLLRRIHVDDGAGPETPRDLMSDAGNAQHAAVLDPCDEAADLGCADVQCSDYPAANLSLHSLASVEGHCYVRHPLRLSPIRVFTLTFQHAVFQTTISILHLVWVTSLD